MARHIMAVCVVCLLYADHMPCQDHMNNLTYMTDINVKVYKQNFDTTASPASMKKDNKNINTYTNINNYNTNNKNHDGNSVEDVAKHYHREKRHAGHAHNEAAQQHVPEITEHFLKRLTMRFSASESLSEQHADMMMKSNDFQRLLMQLGMQQMLIGNNNGTCVADASLVQYVQPHYRRHVADMRTMTNCTNNITKSISWARSLYCDDDDVGVEAKTDSGHNNYTLNAQDLMNLCPVLLYQLSAPTATERAGCIQPALLAAIDKTEAANYDVNKDDIMYVWIYAFISVFACGILGLVGVAIIPFMDSRYYKHIIQYLVSLAVGTMTGDALLHLLPHSLAGQSERNMIFKGFTCMGGVIFFYVTEHGLTMISEWRKSIEKKETKPSRAKVMRDPDSSVNNSVAGDKMCKQKYSSYPYCYDEIAMNNSHKKDVWMHLPGDASAEVAGIMHLRNGKNEHDGTSETAAAAQSLLSTSHNHYAEMNHQQQQQQQQQSVKPATQTTQMLESSAISMDIDGNAVGDGPTIVNGSALTKETVSSSREKIDDTVTVILREHESTHHGHSHRHGHVHSPPESLSAVAWMIIMGDGLHNFTDGMAIGAAFAENIAGGFSTSLAVFCHELPHELGDFAILMKAGMSVKSAVYYNLLTGALSFIGMIFGIVFGQSQEAAQWMFAAAAGLFIYIALVDMMPEISAAHKSLEQFALQILGMLSGVFIMLLIAIYEGDLMNAFSATPKVDHHQHVH